MQTIEIPVTKELQEFLSHKYQNRAVELVDDFLIYMNTQKEAYEVNMALQEVKKGKTNNKDKILNNLKNSVNELKMIKEGKLQARQASEFLDEI